MILGMPHMADMEYKVYVPRWACPFVLVPLEVA